MPARTRRVLVLAVTVLAGLAFTACAHRAERKAMDLERLMIAAGFQMRLADTPEKLQHLESLKPQRKIVTHVKDGRNVYVYADAKFCECLYAGNQEAFDAFQKVARDKELADQLAAGDRIDEEASLNWQIWGPWW